MSLTCTAPCRIDLAGGTLDIHPIYLFLPDAVTVNLAINIGVRVTVEAVEGAAHEIVVEDREVRFSLGRGERDAIPVGGELIASVLDHFEPALETALRITTRSFSPPGAGLAASSALCVALTSVLQELTDESRSADALAKLCLDLEARILGTPAGYQDFYAAINGGLQEIVFRPGGIEAAPIRSNLEKLSEHLLLFYTGVPHHSGLNNWEVFKAFIDGDRGVRGALREIGSVAAQMAGALHAQDWPAVGHLLAREWRHRQTLSASVSIPVIDTLIAQAEKFGGAGKVCGAGGGGCIILWHDGRGEAEAALRATAEELGATALDWGPDRAGCKVMVG